MGVAAVLFLVCLGIGIAVVLALGAPDGAFRRRMQAEPRTSIGSVRDGQVTRLVGTLELAEESLIAPLSGRRCALYHLVIEEDRGTEGSSWQAIVEETEIVPFVIRDSSEDHARVVPVVPELLITKDVHLSSGFLNDATPQLERLLERHGRTSTGLLGFNKTIRYREGVLEAGELVAVFGRCRREPDPDAEADPSRAVGYRETARAERVVVEPPDDGSMLISDDLQTMVG